MKIYQVLNNNVVTCIDKGKEVVYIGTGIGFHKKSMDDLEEEKIQQKYILTTNALTEQLINLMEQTPSVYLEIVSNIIERSKQVLQKELNENLFITLTDHIAFTIERYQKGFVIKNAFRWDIKKLYENEFLLGKYAIQLIHEQLNIDFEDDEAAFIALHIMNAEFNVGIDVMEQITKVIRDVMKIILYDCGKEIDEDSLIYLRLMNHLKYFAQRIMSKTPYEEKDNPLIDVIVNNYPKAYACSLKIKEFICESYACEISQEELVYLSIHIQRLLDV